MVINSHPGKWMNKWMNEWMHEWMFNKTHQQADISAFGCQTKVNQWNGD